MLRGDTAPFYDGSQSKKARGFYVKQFSVTITSATYHCEELRKDRSGCNVLLDVLLRNTSTIKLRGAAAA